MSIEEFINAVRNRPFMYEEKIDMNFIYYLIVGFLGSNLMKDKVYEIDKIFKRHFLKWLLNWVKENVNPSYEEKSFYWQHILIEITDSQEDAVGLFFELSEKFFEEYKI